MRISQQTTKEQSLSVELRPIVGELKEVEKWGGG
jgi:hypothetical protein